MTKTTLNALALATAFTLPAAFALPAVAADRAASPEKQRVQVESPQSREAVRIDASAQARDRRTPTLDDLVSRYNP